VFILAYLLVLQLWSPSECERNKGTGALCSTSCFRFPEIDVPVTLFDFVRDWSHLDDMFQVFSGAEDPLVRQGRGEQKNQKRCTSVAKHASMTPVPQRSYTTVSLISLALSSIPSSSSSSPLTPIALLDDDREINTPRLSPIRSATAPTLALALMNSQLQHFRSLRWLHAR
jgi:hypothetical protein